jgi:flavodoxin
LVPFCTHEGSGFAHSVPDLEQACPNSKMLPGLAIIGSNVGQADNEIANWLEKNGLAP